MQSQELFDALKETLSKRKKKRPIVFIGHSQGGLRAYCTAKKFEEEEEYKIEGVVTIGTPWMGS